MADPIFPLATRAGIEPGARLVRGLQIGFQQKVAKVAKKIGDVLRNDSL
jgi:hypothetical protein